MISLDGREEATYQIVTRTPLDGPYLGIHRNGCRRGNRAWSSSILNVASSGKFSSDRAIAQFATEYGRWNRAPYPGKHTAMAGPDDFTAGRQACAEGHAD